MVPVGMKTLSESDWQVRQTAYEQRLDHWLQPELDRRSRGAKHPVFDFLFEYYPFRPSRLRRWSPGVNTVLQGDSARVFLDRKYFEPLEGGVGLSASAIPEKRRAAARWIRNLLEATAARKPMLGCYGLHEWAMVYNPADVRHDQFPLRLPQAKIREFIERFPVCCSHFDAFRFFSSEARPFNLLQPQADRRAEFEQPGCLHANMDLYKWCFKLSPWIPSELLADCFEEAIRIREVDMCASPYDLRALGYEPIAVETEAGRAHYRAEQEKIAGRAQALRARLILAARPLCTFL